jgi:hypothetical protein
MLRLKIKREWKKPDYTIGRLLVNGIRFCETLEDTDRGINSNYTAAAIRLIKVVGYTAIPAGTYKVVLSASRKFKNKSWAARYGGLVPEILDVKGFSGVRIHPGNGPEQTDGCPLVGDNKVKGGLVNSQKRYLELMDKYLMPAWNRNEEISITIE